MEKKTAAKVEGVKTAVKEAVAETKEQAKEAKEDCKRTGKGSQRGRKRTGKRSQGICKGQESHPGSEESESSQGRVKA